MGDIMKSIISLSIILLFTSNSVFAKLLSGISGSKPIKDASGEITETQFKDPLADFIILDKVIAEQEMLNDIPGRIVAFCEKESKTYFIPYGNSILKHNTTPPEIKNEKLTFESFVINKESASQIGFLIAEAGTSSDYRIEYNLFKGPTTSIRMSDIDRREFTRVSKGLTQKLKNNSDCNLKDVLFIESATIIYQKFRALKKVDAKGKVNGPGWNIDGQFFQTDEKEQNRTLLAVKVTPFLSNDYINMPPELIEEKINKIEENINLKNSNRAVIVDKSSLGDLGKNVKQIYQVE